MVTYESRGEFTVEEIAECLSKTKQEVRKMLEDSGSIANLRMLGCKVPKRDIANLMQLNQGTENERKLNNLLSSTKEMK